MKVQIASDIHTEFWRGFNAPDILKVVAPTDADVIILAGDIGNGQFVNGVPQWAPHVAKLAQARDAKIVKIPGNHEYYKGIIEESDDAHLLMDRISEGKIISGNPRVAHIGNIRFIMCTLWAANFRSSYEKSNAFRCMNDYNLIKTKAPAPDADPETELFVRPFHIDDMVTLNKRHLAFLTEALIDSDERTVVVTHHAPSTKSCMPIYRGDPLNGAYQNDLDDFIKALKNPPELWVHGHTHSSHDYEIGGTRVVCNPSGYWRDGGFENHDYNPELVIEL